MSNRRNDRLKRFTRALRSLRNRATTRLFDTRYGRELLINALGPRVVSMTIDAGDHLMSFSPSDYIGRKVFRKGHFERNHVDRLLAVLGERGLLKQAPVLLEIGANIGTQTVYFALSNRFSRIVAIEPDPRNFALLAANIAANGFQEQVAAVNCAAGDREGVLDFFQNRNNHGKSGATRVSASDDKITVPMRPVTAILTDADVDALDVGLIWMDIEGYEPIACRSMEGLMARRVPMQMEFSPAFYGPRRTADFVTYLAGYYEDCLTFSEQGPLAMKVADLPVEGAQFDILLLP